MDDGVRMILSTLTLPTIMALTHIGPEMYHKSVKRIVKSMIQNSLSNLCIDGCGKMILSICQYDSNIMGLTRIETE